MEIVNRISSTEVQEEDIIPVAGIESIPLRIGEHTSFHGKGTHFKLAGDRSATTRCLLIAREQPLHP